ncbi:MAG: hypothetical protein EZS28_027405 [Streblomastix strix]|uniref:Uncharacterized protein n=1 Tax=Streblomastix strix TaxID=222440 RepID=A0A5J4V2W3_9EUKA|nr:MAG: hypothetical protein EZS28_027405 [Streblomastix strix]
MMMDMTKQIGELYQALFKRETFRRCSVYVSDKNNSKIISAANIGIQHENIDSNELQELVDFVYEYDLPSKIMVLIRDGTGQISEGIEHSIQIAHPYITIMRQLWRSSKRLTFRFVPPSSLWQHFSPGVHGFVPSQKLSHMDNYSICPLRLHLQRIRSKFNIRQKDKTRQKKYQTPKVAGQMDSQTD